MNERNEEKEDWKKERIEEYAEFEKRKADAKWHLSNDQKISDLLEKRLLLDQEIAIAERLPRHTITVAELRQAEIKQEFMERWDIEGWGIEGKTFECDVGTVTLKTTRSLRIKNKEKLIEFLTALKKLPEFIKSFEIAKLRKIKDAGLLEDEIVTWDAKSNVSISITEGTGEGGENI